MSELDQYLAEHPELEITVTDTCAQVDPWRMGRKKPDDGFRSVLKRMEKFYKKDLGS